MKSRVLMVLSFVPMIVTLFVLRFIPDEIPAHYDAMGNIDRWGSKYEFLILPGLIIIFNVAWVILLNHFQKKQSVVADEKGVKEAIQNEKVMFYVAIGTLIMFAALHVMLMISAVITVKDDLQTMALELGMVSNIFVGSLLIVIGNILPKSKRNSLVGVRTKWSMASDVTWSKSNRFGGGVLMMTGVIMILTSFFLEDLWSLIGMLMILAISTAVIVFYSWKVWQASTFS